MSSANTAVVIVAAGAGLRVGGETPKQYQLLDGVSVLARTVSAFVGHPGVSHVQVVIGAEHGALYDAAVAGLDLPPAVVGGATRQQSVKAGLEAVKSTRPDYVLIHDAARPFVNDEIISHVVANLDRHDGAIPALPVVDTVKRANGSIITGTVDRTALWAAQTPQGFRFDMIFTAHKMASDQTDVDFTDDASIAEWAGLKVALVPGSRNNQKLTTAEDMSEAERHIAFQKLTALGDVRVGHG
ncbi:MAG: 2-C-methyl-D-erythritol 4-phosphate cytidylyltransferase, partial [Aestuariivirgaceae bacterium]